MNLQTANIFVSNFIQKKGWSANDFEVEKFDRNIRVCIVVIFAVHWMFIIVFEIKLIIRLWEWVNLRYIIDESTKRRVLRAKTYNVTNFRLNHQRYDWLLWLPYSIIRTFRLNGFVVLVRGFTFKETWGNNIWK